MSTQTRHLWKIRLMLSDRRYAKDVPILGEVFRRSTVFELLTSKFDRSYRNGARKSVFFWKKRPLTGKKIQNFATKRFMRTMIHVFLPSFAESGSSQTGAWYLSPKKVTVRPLSPGPMERSRQKFYVVTLSSFPIPLPSFSKSVPFPRRFTRKCLTDSLQYRRDA